MRLLSKALSGSRKWLAAWMRTSTHRTSRRCARLCLALGLKFLSLAEKTMPEAKAKPRAVTRIYGLDARAEPCSDFQPGDYPL